MSPREAAFTYNISPNGRAGSWYWEVNRHGTVVARGLANTRVRARADAITSAAPYVEGLTEDDPTLPLEEPPL